MNHPSTPEPVVGEQNRRTFLQLALASGVSLLTTAAWPSEAQAAGVTEALLLTCMDFRLMDDIERYMSGRGLQNKYDHIILAGASLGSVTDKYPAWNKTFWDHLDISIKLHNIQRVIVIDHRDCGAYKLIFGAEQMLDPVVEKNTHAANLKKLKDMITVKYPQLQVETLLMALNGQVETVAVA
jgi:carbonic anhydrase